MKRSQPGGKKEKKAVRKKGKAKRTASLPVIISNRRREWRFDLPLEAVVAGELPQGQPFEEKTTIENISSGGAYFGLNSGVVIGSRLNLTINLPERLTEGRKMQLVLSGTAVRLEKAEKTGKKQGVAVRFSRNYKFVAVGQEET
jgi:c-di-GMP-binding flagellar brake protein YcgR